MQHFRDDFVTPDGQRTGMMELPAREQSLMIPLAISMRHANDLRTDGHTTRTSTTPLPGCVPGSA